VGTLGYTPVNLDGWVEIYDEGGNDWTKALMKAALLNGGVEVPVK
jgi:hypothetical protein